MHEFLHNGRGPVYSVRPTTLSENDHNSEAARFDDNSPTGKERPLDFFGQSAPISLGYAICEGQGDVEGRWDASDAIRALKQVRKGDRVLCYHSAPERALYAIAEVTRDPYPDPHDRESKMMVADLRAMERLPRQIPLDELRNNASVRKVKFLKNVRLIISPVTEEEYQEILRMAGIVATPGLPLP